MGGVRFSVRKTVSFFFSAYVPARSKEPRPNVSIAEDDHERQRNYVVLIYLVFGEMLGYT